MIIPHLRDLQNQYGYLPDAELRQLARETGVPLARIEEVASFFPSFRREWDRPADLQVRVCRDMTCHLRGADSLLAGEGLPALAAELAEVSGRSIRVEGVSCLGRCDRAPALWIEKHRMPRDEHAWVYCGRSVADLEKVLRVLALGSPRPEPDMDTDYSPFSTTNQEIDPYGRDGQPPDYRVIRRFVQLAQQPRSHAIPPQDRPAEDLKKHIEEHHPFLDELRASGLSGMGGAGAPTYGKWLDVWLQPGPEKYIVANGDESEPGTFKDRELMLRWPHLVVEGVILAGLITEASKGIIYIRHEYHEQIAAVRAEIDRAVRLGACGENVFGSGRAFPVEVFESPGGYICGEQSALLEVLEDRRAQPRNRPPELGTNGLHDKPTVVNNVETLAWTPFIFLHGGAAYAEAGWHVPGSEGRLGFAGRRLFSVSGDVNRPGVFEVPIGLPLGELLLEPKYCDGILGQKELEAVATSGPSGGLLPAKLPLDEQFRVHLPAALKRLHVVSAKQAELMEWFVAQHLPVGTTHLDLLAVPLDLVFFRHLMSVLELPVELMLGAGLVVYGQGSDPLEQTVNCTRFFREESCGKCVPCRIGSHKLYQLGLDLIARRDRGDLSREEVETVQEEVLEISRAMQQTSICGLGYVAPIPLSSALTWFAGDVLTKPTGESTGRP